MHKAVLLLINAQVSWDVPYVSYDLSSYVTTSVRLKKEACLMMLHGTV